MKGFLEKLSAERCTGIDFQNTMNAATVFGEGYGSYGSMNAENMYFIRFRRIPNLITLDSIDCKKVGEWLVQKYGDSITDCSYKKYYDSHGKLMFEDVYCFAFDDVIVHLCYDLSRAVLLYRKTDSATVEKLADGIMRFKKRPRRKPEIKLLVMREHGLSTETMDIANPRLSIEDNYNDDFMPVHQTITARLRRKSDKGLVLLHGKPGTGKTSYIRHIIATTRKPVIFLPPNMAASVTDPGLINVLIDYPNSIFVIEDAENIIIDRNSSGSSSVSALLNLADGLLSDCLNIQIVCSFNTDISRVDSALTRKGRLIAKYEFLELEARKAQALSKRLGFSSAITSPMTLAAVYNQNDTDFAAKAQRKTVGFSIAV
ncbi:MAG: ATP-binding protein [Bacteroidales bacterium]|jgi:hypothetical protein|nr:ATP-binding protein [Bacteroidales bacterium]